MALIKIEATIDASQVAHIEALNLFLNGIGGADAEIKTVVEKPAAPAPVVNKTVEKPAPAPAPVVEKTVEAPAPAPVVETPAITLQDIRLAMSERINEHRPAMKAKLDELGVPNATKLEEKDFSGFMDFLKALD